MNSMDEIRKKIKERREQLGYSYQNLADLTNLSKSTLQRYESGNIGNLPLDKIAVLSQALQCSPAYLMGWEDQELSSSIPPGLEPLLPMKKIPLLGDIACGEPILAEQNITDYIEIPSHIHADYALTCHGDSMVGAGIHDGDLVYIRQQPTVENGQIAAVLVDGEEATLKRVYLDRGAITISPANPKYPPKSFSGEAASRVQVIGRAVAYIHIIRD